MKPFSPGPWVVGYVDEPRARIEFIGGFMDIVTNRPEALAANVRLMANAPALLEQLKLLVRWAEDQGQSCSFAKAAIAMAVGEQGREPFRGRPETCRADTPSYTCPHCGAVSYNKNDIEQQYCGACHMFAYDSKT